MSVHPHFHPASPSSHPAPPKMASKGSHKLSPFLEAKTKAEIELLMDELDFNSSSTSKSRVGSRPIAQSTLLAYQKHYNGLKYFFSLIGDYESLLILLEYPPEPFCPSMDPNSIALFINWKRYPAGSPLLEIGNGSVILADVEGNPIRCQGTWNDPNNVNQLLSAVGAIHEARNQGGAYFNSCEDCIDIYTRLNDKSGCRFHTTAQLWRRGNPRTAVVVKNTFKQSNIDGSGYVAEGDSALTPWELLSLRDRLLSTNSLWDLEFWVMTLIAIKLFLREDEVNWKLILLLGVKYCNRVVSI